MSRGRTSRQKAKANQVYDVPIKIAGFTFRYCEMTYIPIYRYINHCVYTDRCLMPTWEWTEGIVNIYSIFNKMTSTTKVPRPWCDHQQSYHDLDATFSNRTTTVVFMYIQIYQLYRHYMDSWRIIKPPTDELDARLRCPKRGASVGAELNGKTTTTTTVLSRWSE